jgi:hypothetical protein
MLVHDSHRRAITHPTERRDERLGRFGVRILQKAQRAIPVRRDEPRRVHRLRSVRVRADEIEQFLLKARQVQLFDQRHKLRFAHHWLQKRVEARFGLGIRGDGIAVEQRGGCEGRFGIGFEEDGQSGGGDFGGVFVGEELEGTKETKRFGFSDPSRLFVSYIRATNQGLRDKVRTPFNANTPDKLLHEMVIGWSF